MKRAAITVLLISCCLLVFSQTTIHYWDFNAGASGTNAMQWPSPVAAAYSANYGSIIHSFDNTDRFTGTTMDASGFTSTAGESFSVVGINNNGGSFLINASTLGFKDIELTYATRGTSTGFATQTIDYTLDGINYVNSTVLTGRTATSYTLQTISFVSLTAANNNPNFKIRISLAGASSSSGNNRFDNIRITGTVSSCSPTNQPTSLVLTPAFNSIAGSFAAAAPGTINASGYLVVMSSSSTLSSQPANGNVYNADDVIGNGIVVSAANSTTFNAGSLTPGSTYYFFIYSYDNSTDCFNLLNPLTGNSTTTSPPACTEPSVQVSGLSAPAVTTSSIDLSYTRGNGNKVMIIAREGSAVSQSPINSLSYSTGSQMGLGNYILYNGTASSFSYPGLSSNTTYYFALYEYNDAGVCYNPNPLTGNFTTSCASPADITSFNAIAGNGKVTLAWLNPSAGCYDQFLVVVSSANITGQGSDYTGAANTVYSSGEQVVYKSTGSTVIVTGLSNNTNYYFKIFTRLGGTWSGGNEIIAKPFDPSSGYQYLFGNLHSHSSYSDGNKENTSKTPQDDYAYARDANCMDFLGISEHNHSGAGMNHSDYLTGFNEAGLVNGVTSPTTGNSIVTLWGMEWGVISNGGHVLVYGFDDKLIGWEAGNYDNYVAKNDYGSLWTLINNKTGAFATLAHPNFSDYNNLASSYNTSADNAVVGTAIESGPAFSLSTSYNDFPSSLGDLGYFKTLLAKGYHVAPQIDHDNHYMTFGTVNTNRTVVLATAKTRSAMMEALRAGRYYGSQDCNARVDFRNNNDPMGSAVTKGGLPSLSLLVNDPDSEITASIELWGAAVGSSVPSSAIKTYNNISAFTFNSGDAVNVQPDNSTWYYFVIITQADGNKIVTSPIWYTRSDLVLPVTLTSFTGAWSIAKNETILSWTTAREINSREFIVQHSADHGISWNDIGVVAANGNSGFNQHYSFKDDHPETENWYRLKMVDADDQYSYSKVIVLDYSPVGAVNYTLYPNPATGYVTVTSSSVLNKEIFVKLIDNTGRTVLSQNIVAGNTASSKISLLAFHSGLYYLVIDDGQQLVRKKLVIAGR